MYFYLSQKMLTINLQYHITFIVLKVLHCQAF